MTYDRSTEPGRIPCTLTVEGLRGFSSAQKVPLAPSTGERGSGLTFLVGPNNSGKSTCVEALRVMALANPPSFSTGQRNKLADSRVRITVRNATGGLLRSLASTDVGGSETTFGGPSETPLPIITVSSRRNFRPYFNRRTIQRDSYMHQAQLPSMRGFDDQETFTGRIQRAMEHRNEFNHVLGKILPSVPNWCIDRSDHGMFYLRFSDARELDHSSDGLGDGMMSVFYIVDALYDSEPGQLIVIDEPELSLHPALQRRVMDLLADYASTRQIVVATHSPYFVSLEALAKGARLSRLVKRGGEIAAHDLSDESRDFVRRQLADRNNPHVLGLDGREVFFLDDRVILVEGQEDVIYYQLLASNLGTRFEGEFFGWGVGGASKMGGVARILRDLGFEKVVGILDKGEEAEAEILQRRFSEYTFRILPAGDIRTKAPVRERPGVEGLLDENLRLRDEYRHQTEAMVEDVNASLR